MADDVNKAIGELMRLTSPSIESKAIGDLIAPNLDSLYSEAPEVQFQVVLKQMIYRRVGIRILLF